MRAVLLVRDGNPHSKYHLGMLELQHSKRELAAAALSGQAVKGAMKLTLNDIMGAFLLSPRMDLD